MMQLGAEAVFVGSGIFKSEDPAVRAKAIVRATTHCNDPKVVAEVSRAWARRCTDRNVEACRNRSFSNARLVTGTTMARIGVLALQGDFEAHAKAFARPSRARSSRCVASPHLVRSRRARDPRRREHDPAEPHGRRALVSRAEGIPPTAAAR